MQLNVGLSPVQCLRLCAHWMVIFRKGDSTTSRDGQRTRGSVSCGHDVSGADHWLHRDGHVSDRHFSSAIHFNINTLGHMKVMRNIVFVGNTVLISLLAVLVLVSCWPKGDLSDVPAGRLHATA